MPKVPGISVATSLCERPTFIIKVHWGSEQRMPLALLYSSTISTRVQSRHNGYRGPGSCRSSVSPPSLAFHRPQSIVTTTTIVENTPSIPKPQEEWRGARKHISHAQAFRMGNTCRQKNIYLASSAGSIDACPLGWNRNHANDTYS